MSLRVWLRRSSLRREMVARMLKAERLKLLAYIADLRRRGAGRNP